MSTRINGYLVTVRIGTRYLKFKVVSTSGDGAVRTVHRRIPLISGVSGDYFRGLQSGSLDWEVTEVVEFDLSDPKLHEQFNAFPLGSGQADFMEWKVDSKKWTTHGEEARKE